MLNNATGLKRIILITGYSDLRKGVEGLAGLVKFEYGMDPFEENVLFLFCGRQACKLKGLIWEGDGFLLLSKRLEASGRYNWPRNRSEALQLSKEQFSWLMKGMEIEPGIQPVKKPFTL